MENNITENNKKKKIMRILDNIQNNFFLHKLNKPI